MIIFYFFCKIRNPSSTNIFIFKVNFLLRKLFRGYLNEAISLAEIQPMILVHLDFHGKFSLKGNLPPIYKADLHLHTLYKACDIFNPSTLSWQGPLSYRNQSIDLQSKSMYWFLYDNGLRHKRVKHQPTNCLSVFDHFVGLALKGLKISHRVRDKTTWLTGRTSLIFFYELS